MDRKNINLKINLSDLRLTEEHKKKIAGWLLKNLRLFFIIFLGAVTIYSFDIIFKKAYVEINYVEYPAYTNALVDTKGKAMLEKVMQSIELRKNNSESLETKRYVDPFSYRENTTAEKPAAASGSEKAVSADAAGDKAEQESDSADRGEESDRDN